ncbi:MAG: UDP-N-acetylmuramoylalanine--D-glutamate ligase [Planctomycetota bacterium]
MPADEPAHDSPIVADMTVTVMGIGRFGGGVGVVRHLLDRGCRVIATDLLDEASLAEVVAQLRAHPAADRLELRLGRHETRDFTEADLVVANPAVPRPSESAFLNAARERGVPITTEIRLAVDALPKRRQHRRLAARRGPEHLRPGLGRARTLELHAALARRGSPPMVAAACGAHEPQPEPSRLAWRPPELHPREVPDRRAPRRAQAGIDWWTTPAKATEHHWNAVDPEAIDLRVLGSHQRRNARLALAAVKAILEIEAIEREHEKLHRSLGEFTGLPHRLQLLPSLPGLPNIRFIDDSKSTTPDATLLAIEALEDPSRVHLIAGGADKGADLAAIRGQAPSLAGLYAIGSVSTALMHGDSRDARSLLSGTLRQAIEDAMPKLRDGDTLLLSPGCASWDQFSDYRERGKAFAAEIARRAGGDASP